MEASTQAATEAIRATTEGSIVKSTGGSTADIRDEFGSFNANGRVFTQMQPPCPPGGALDYVTLPAIRTAQANLNDLARMGLPAAAGDRRRYVALIWNNIRLLKSSMNIQDRFLFPTAISPIRGDAPLVTEKDLQDFTTSATTTLWTLTGDGRWDATEAQQQRRQGMPEPRWTRPLENGLYTNGAQVPSPYEGRLPQAALDMYATLRHEFLARVAAELPAKVEGGIVDAYQKWTDERASMPCIPPLQSWCAGITPEYLSLNPDSSRSWGPHFPWALASTETPDVVWGSEGLYVGNSRETPRTDWSSGSGVTRLVAIPTIYNVPLQLRLFQSLASIFGTLNVAQTIADAVGFYTFNHNVFFADLLGKTDDQVRSDQQTAMQLRLATNEVNAAVTGTTAAVLSIVVGPLVSAIYLALGQLGNWFLGWLIGGALQPTMPYPLFIRVPPENCPIMPVETSTSGRACTPPCTTGNTCVSGVCRPVTTQKKASVVGPAVAVGAAIFLFSLLRGR